MAGLTPIWNSLWRPFFYACVARVDSKKTTRSVTNVIASCLEATFQTMNFGKSTRIEMANGRSIRREKAIAGSACRFGNVQFANVPSPYINILNFFLSRTDKASEHRDGTNRQTDI